MNELKETLNEEIKYFKNRLQKKNLTEITRQYLLGRLTSLESVLETMEAIK